MEKKPTPKAVRITAYTFFALLLLIISLLIGELYARSQPEYGRAGFIFTKDLIYRLTPNLVAQKAYALGKAGKPPFTLQFNSQGFRGKDFSKSSPDNTTRILMIGDSYTAGLDYPDSLIFSERWAQKLNSSGGNKFEVLNASCPAWGADQEYLFWKKEGIDLHPDHVVIMMSPNDLREAWNHNVVKYNKAMQELEVTVPQLPFKEKAGWCLASKFSFYQLLQKKVFNTDYGNFLRIFWSFPVNYGIQDSTDWDMPLFLKEPFPALDDSYELLEKIYVDIKKDCERIGAELHIVKIPIRLEIDDTYRDTTRFNQYIVEERIKDITVRNGIHFHNFNEPLRLHPSPSDIYMEWEHHYDEGGHNWIAKMLYEHIKL